MKSKIVSKRAKKLVRWHSSYVVFLTPEVKELKWTKNKNVKVSVIREGKSEKIVIEKLEL